MEGECGLWRSRRAFGEVGPHRLEGGAGGGGADLHLVFGEDRRVAVTGETQGVHFDPAGVFQVPGEHHGLHKIVGRIFERMWDYLTEGDSE